MTTTKCPTCHKPFEAARADIDYCGPECKRIARNERDRVRRESVVKERHIQSHISCGFVIVKDAEPIAPLRSGVMFGGDEIDRMVDLGSLTPGTVLRNIRTDIVEVVKVDRGKFYLESLGRAVAGCGNRIAD
jgi:hypothetical protein